MCLQHFYNHTFLVRFNTKPSHSEKYYINSKVHYESYQRTKFHQTIFNILTIVRKNSIQVETKVQMLVVVYSQTHNHCVIRSHQGLNTYQNSNVQFHVDKLNDYSTIIPITCSCLPYINGRVHYIYYQRTKIHYPTFNILTIKRKNAIQDTLRKNIYGDITNHQSLTSYQK